VQPYLHVDEHLLWAGQPDPAKVFSSTDAFVVPFSLIWGGLASYWEATVIDENAPVLFKLWGLPFVLFACYLVIGRFFVKRRQREHTIYAITDQRALVVSGTHLIDTPITDRPTTVRWSRDRRHASVMIGGAVGSWIGTAMRMNAGIALSQPRTVWGTMGFFDVSEPAEMLQALDQACRGGRPTA
jgi:hypothetical protein